MRGQTERNLTGGEDPQQTQVPTVMSNSSAPEKTIQDMGTLILKEWFNSTQQIYLHY